MIALLVAVAASQSFAPTPQSAALGAVYSDPKKPAIVKRINVAGSYATVLTSGGRIEGDVVTEAILVKRFSFGWQPLDLLNDQCRLDAQMLGNEVAARLIRAMPQPKNDRPCTKQPHDAGPPTDVTAVRKLMQGPLVPYVVVAGDWAMGEWYGAGGGESLYRRRNGEWQLVESGGGAMDTDYMRKYGVPESAWCAFGIFDAKCP